MKENSIEEAIKILEEFKTHGYAMLLIKYEDRNKANRKLNQAIEHILSAYQEVLKENEELKFEERSRIIGKCGDAEIHDVINKVLSNDYIPVQKIKNKIEELENYIQENSDEQGYWGNINSDIIYGKIEILEESLEESED